MSLTISIIFTNTNTIHDHDVCLLPQFITSGEVGLPISLYIKTLREASIIIHCFWQSARVEQYVTV